MRRTIILMMIFIAAISFGQAQNLSSESPITQGLEEEIQKQGSEEFIEVIIRMKEQFDSQDLIRTTWGMTKEQKREYTVRTLKQYARESQRELLDYIGNFKTSNSVKDVRTYWLANVINCKMKPAAIKELAKRDDIDRIGYDHKRILIDPNANKNAQSEPGNLGGQREITWNVTKINADDVWGLGYDGEGVTVAVIDAGVNYNHLDLADHMWDDPNYPYHGYDFVNDDNDPMDDHGHGTHCAGTVAGDGTAGSQTGVAPEATIMALKVLDSGGSGQQSDTWDAVEFTVDNGGDVMSISLGWQHSWGVDRESFRNFFDNALAAGVIASVAAGNEGDQQWQYPIPDNVRTPGDIPPPWLHPDQTLEGGVSSVVCVGATDINDNIAGFSSRGPVTWEDVSGYNDYPYEPEMGLIRPDIVAPGVDVKSLDAFNNSGYASGWSGTSMATPANAGLIALMLQKNDLLNPAEINQLIEENALPLSSNKSNTYGSGRIDALQTINNTPPPIPTNQPFVVYNDHMIDDGSGGNGDGTIDNGESIDLDMEMINLGDQPSVGDVNVLITTSSDYVTITDDNENFGSFGVGDSTTIQGAFAFDVMDGVPDGHEIEFFLEASDDDYVFESDFVVEVQAPHLQVGSLSISDANGGNGDGILDPGETADLLVETTNSGSNDAPSTMATLASTNSYLTINSSTYDFGNLPAGTTEYASFNVTVAQSAPIGTSIDLDYTVTSGEYSSTKLFYAKVGLDVEDFESGDFSSYDWSFGGDADWVIDSDVAYEGSYSARSGSIGNQSESELSITIEDILGDTLSFYRKVSSEASYDYLRFYIDGDMVDEWAGEHDWEYMSYYVESGTHTFTWAYEKDYSVSSGDDAGWIDYVEFPATQNPEPPVADFEADVETIYTGEEVNFTDLSSNEPTEWEWEFVGGTPQTSNEQNPTVTYDEPGSYMVSLTASNEYGSDTEVKTDYILVLESHFDFEGGNPADPVYTMYLSGATMEGEDLEEFDEIAIFDGGTMVGQITLTQVCTPDNQFENDLIAFSTVVSGNGYDPGNDIILKGWDASEEMESSNVEITFYDPYGDAWTEPYFPSEDGVFSIADVDFLGGGMQQMTLQTGYQFVSSYMVPPDPDMMTLLEEPMNDETLDFIRDSEGSMLQKIGPNWVNNIGDWNTMEGYLFKMFEDDMMAMEGSIMDPQTPMPLDIGYQFISYLPQQPMDALDAFELILEELDFVRDSEGSMLQKIGPNWVNNIGDLHPGQGYLVKMIGADELVYPEMTSKSGIVKLENEYFDFAGGNPADPVYTVYIQALEGIEVGDEVAVYDGDKMVGAGMIEGENALQNDVPVFATLTDEKGYKAGHALSLKVYDASEEKLLNVDFRFVNPYGDARVNGLFPENDGEYTIAQVAKSASVLEENTVSAEIFPNPANDVVNVVATENIRLISVIDYTGKLVKEINPANTNATINVANFNQGMYVIKVETATQTLTRRIVVK